MKLTQENIKKMIEKIKVCDQMIEETKQERFKREQRSRELLGDAEYERLYRLAAELLEKQFKSALRISD